MSKKVGFLQRWMFIINKINSCPYITRRELEEALKEELFTYDGVENVGTKTRTLERDLSEIRNSPYMDISIEFCRQRKGYYIPKNEKSLSKIDRLFELSSLFSFSELKDIVFVEDRKSKGLEHRFGLIGAIRNNKEIVVEYRKFNEPGIKEKRRLQPYALREFKNRWYLLAIEANSECKDEDSIKTWGLDRIESYEITRQSFKKNKTINPNKQFEYCFGIFSNKALKPERMILSFPPIDGKYHEACPLHSTQRTLIKNEEEYRFELTVKLTPDFIMELLAHSRGMRVIEPSSLRNTLIEIHRNAIDLLQE